MWIHTCESFSLCFRIYGKEDCGTNTSRFVDTPKHHVFPLATLPNNTVLRVQVDTLPRFDFRELWHVLGTHQDLCTPNGTSHCICLNSDTFQPDNGTCNVVETDEKFAFSSPLRKRSCRLGKSYSSETHGGQVERSSTRERNSQKYQNLSNSTCARSSPDQELVVSNGLHQVIGEQSRTHLASGSADHCIEILNDFKIVSKDSSQRTNDKTSDVRAEEVS